LIKKLYFIFITIFSYFFLINTVHANFQEKLINKLKETKSLSFDFIQKINEDEEIGNCFIKYPLLMKCNYEDVKKKSIISNGETVAIIKRKYKKIYYYPIEKTLLLVILEKNKIINLIKNNKPVKVDDSIIKYEFFGKKSNKLKLFFDKNSLDLKGWETIDAYSNRVKFSIINLETNVTISDDFFKIPREKDL
tara:strand:+ start:1458 stop:2036 length:579 start_codon:yes stop_codon:yes gene_type:complete